MRDWLCCRCGDDGVWWSLALVLHLLQPLFLLLLLIPPLIALRSKISNSFL